ncbi:EfeM/EfeO family lipoprotein [Geitlerinema sp. CS-897]|nr:EfeM/EfeO family lipoprotein [Geitlerinema sp. CS-897]
MKRRNLLQAATVGVSGTLALTVLSRRGIAQTPTIASDPYADRVDEGLTYFKRLAVEQLDLAEQLLEAVRSNDLERARTAYVRSRPPYEQIEVLAASFEQTDSDIDARPYSFDGGELDPEFISIHKIEALIFRDGDLRATLPYAEGLIDSVNTLIGDLDRRENFSSQKHFEGCIALATEVAAKKISSEEETWSDRSLMIFRQNWNGIYSQFQPFVSVLDENTANAVRQAYEAAQQVIEPYFQRNAIGGEPYSSINPRVRGQIVRASYTLRDRLLDAAAELQLA